MKNGKIIKESSLRAKTFDVRFDSHGFYHIYLKPGGEITMDDFMKIAEFMIVEMDRKKAPFLIEFGYGCSFSEGVFEAMAQGASRHSLADAFLIQTYAHNLYVEYYIKNSNPTTPARIFRSKDAALSWMAQYKE